MTLFLAITTFWTALFWAVKFSRKRWILRRLLQPVRYVSEIGSVEYYAQLSDQQFERLITKSLKEQGFVILDDPYLGRSKSQGYAWKKGKKYVIVQHPRNSLSPEKLDLIQKAAKLARADRTLVFYPAMEAPKPLSQDIQMLAGKQLISWFAVLNGLRPPTPHYSSAERCSCGAGFQPRINSAGNLLVTCSQFPVCRTVRLIKAIDPDRVPVSPQSARAGSTRKGDSVSQGMRDVAGSLCVWSTGGF